MSGVRIELQKKIYVVEIRTDELTPCKPKGIELWSWRRMKTVKHVLHLQGDGTIEQYEVS